LALDVTEGQPVLDQIEYSDYLIAQDRRGRGKILNPAGFYIWAIEQNLSLPEEFETSTKREQQRNREQAAHEEQGRMLKLQQEYDDFCQEQIQQRLEYTYPGDRLELAVVEQTKALKREQPDWFNRVPDSTRRELALCRLRTLVKDALDLPDFGRWIKMHPQLRIF
jgi:hypothetical protein